MSSLKATNSIFTLLRNNIVENKDNIGNISMPFYLYYNRSFSYLPGELIVKRPMNLNLYIVRIFPSSWYHDIDGFVRPRGRNLIHTESNYRKLSNPEAAPCVGWLRGCEELCDSKAQVSTNACNLTQRNTIIKSLLRIKRTTSK